MFSDTVQLIFVDLLFLGLAGSLGFWFRTWLKTEKKAFDERLEALEAQQATLDRLSGRLQATCQLLEVLTRAEGGAQDARRSPSPGSARVQTRTEERYEQARKLLAQGVQSGEVARKLGLGMAEVELMERILHHRNQE